MRGVGEELGQIKQIIINNKLNTITQKKQFLKISNQELHKKQNVNKARGKP